MAVDRSCFRAPNRYCPCGFASPSFPKLASRLAEKITRMRKSPRHGSIELLRIMV
jgi:hypothetical protein